MQTRYTDAIPLAPRPSLEQYRKQAKDLLQACRTGDPDAVRTWATDWLERLAKLQSATSQFDRRQINDEVDHIVEDAKRAALADPSTATLSRTQLFVARLHGFESWPKFVKHLEERRVDASAVSRFEAAADAIVTGDIETLQRLLRENPGLVRARSTRDHRATLLHYIAANGHEGFRQRSPKNAVAIAKLLLESGAEPDALATMYNHQCTTMEMLVSSTPPAVAGVQEALVDVLLDFGADVDGPKHDGSPMLTAFRFHFPKSAERLAARGASVDNIVSAAALGRVDLVDRFLDDNGSLRADVALPDVPWPKLPRDPKVHVATAFTWAVAFGRDDVVELMLRKHVDPTSEDSDASALHYAAASGRTDLVRVLLARGASLEKLNSYGGTVLDGVVWMALNDPQSDVDYRAVVRDLVTLGARTDVYPELPAYVDAVLAGRRGGGYPDVPTQPSEHT